MRLTLEVAFALAAAIFLGTITFSAMNAHVPAFVIIEADQQESNSSLPYRAVEAESIVQQGGIILTQAAPAESLEGTSASHVVIVQWPNLEAARRWYRSSATRAADKSRATGGRRVVVVQGATDWP